MEIGSVLKEAREAKNISLEMVEQRTNIRKKYLNALENEDFELLPGRVYAKGFLKNYANFLDLDPHPLLAAFDEKNPIPKEEEEPDIQTFVALEKPKRTGYIVVGIIGAMLVFFLAYNPWNNQVDAPVEPNANLQDNNYEPIGGNGAEQQDENTPPPQVQGVKVVLDVVEQTSWMSVEVDGVQTFQGILSAGETKEFEGVQEISLRLGNPGVVEVEYNGDHLGFLGQNGQPISKVFSATQG